MTIWRRVSCGAVGMGAAAVRGPLPGQPPNARSSAFVAVSTVTSPTTRIVAWPET